MQYLNWTSDEVKIETKQIILNLLLKENQTQMVWKRETSEKHEASVQLFILIRVLSEISDFIRDLQLVFSKCQKSITCKLGDTSFIFSCWKYQHAKIKLVFKHRHGISSYVSSDWECYFKIAIDKWQIHLRYLPVLKTKSQMKNVNFSDK